MSDHPSRHTTRRPYILDPDPNGKDSLYHHLRASPEMAAAMRRTADRARFVYIPAADLPSMLAKTNADLRADLAERIEAAEVADDIDPAPVATCARCDLPSAQVTPATEWLCWACAVVAAKERGHCVVGDGPDDAACWPEQGTCSCVCAACIELRRQDLAGAEDIAADHARRERARLDRMPAPRTGYQPPRYAWTGHTPSARERFIELATWTSALRSHELAELAHLAADPATADDAGPWSAALIEIADEHPRNLARIETSRATARAILAAMVTPCIARW